jgi:DNA-binding transcriptional LysR family regulator
MKYRITDIKNFVETTSCDTIMEASRKLEISQPALSESIKRLESDLGALVFYRSRTGIQLTPSGKNFLFKAQKALQSFNDLDLSNSSENLFAGRSISIGCHPTVAQYSIPKALLYLKEKAPDYKIELKHDLSRNVQNEIQRGHLDIGIVINAVEVPDLVIKNLAQDTVGVWSHKSLTESDTVLANLDLFQSQSILKKWKSKPNKVISTDSLELICRLVHEKIGYGILPTRAVELSGLPLRMLASLPTYKDQISIVHRPEFGKSTAEKLVIEALKRALV